MFKVYKSKYSAEEEICGNLNLGILCILGILDEGMIKTSTGKYYKCLSEKYLEEVPKNKEGYFNLVWYDVFNRWVIISFVPMRWGADIIIWF